MKFSKAMMALDFTKMDKSLLSYFKYISAFLGVDEVYFIHIVKMFSIPKLVRSQFGSIMAPDFTIDETCTRQLEQEIGEFNLPIQDGNMFCIVKEGRPVDELVTWSEEHRVNLVIVGNKETHEGSGITSRRVAHRINCNMLFVPERSKTPIDDITVLLDFSEHSIKAIESAILFHNKLNHLKIRVVHIQENVGSFMYPTTNTGTNVTSMMRERTLAAFEKLMSENNIDKNLVEFVLIDQETSSISRTLKEYLELRPTDLVIMGSAGHGKGRNLLYGSTTESFVDSYLESPILVVR